jgi:hypothetical protein
MNCRLALSLTSVVLAPNGNVVCIIHTVVAFCVVEENEDERVMCKLFRVQRVGFDPVASGNRATAD